MTNKTKNKSLKYVVPIIGFLIGGSYLGGPKAYEWIVIKNINLTGKWEITDTTKISTEKSFIDSEIKFFVYIRQNGEKFTGEGEKVEVNGKPIPYNNRTELSFEGTINPWNKIIDASIKEEGHKRNTVGLFKWEIMSDSVLVGAFLSTSAGTEGSSRCIKLK